VRAAIKKGREQYKQLKLGALGGELAIETVCEPIEEVEGMTEEELKRWKAFKKQAKGGSGKMKSGNAGAKQATTATAAGEGFGEQQAEGGFGGLQAWGWGLQLPPGPPPQQFSGQCTEKGADIMCYQITMRTCTVAIYKSPRFKMASPESGAAD
jgi:hypothetical protein